MEQLRNTFKNDRSYKRYSLQTKYDERANVGNFLCISGADRKKGGCDWRRINPTGKKRFQQALRNKEFDYILSQALEQEEAGAQILDVNVAYPILMKPI